MVIKMKIHSSVRFKKVYFHPVLRNAMTKYLDLKWNKTRMRMLKSEPNWIGVPVGVIDIKKTLIDHVTAIYSANEYWIITPTFSKARRHKSKKPLGDLAPTSKRSFETLMKEQTGTKKDCLGKVSRIPVLSISLPCLQWRSLIRSMLLHCFCCSFPC